MPIEARAVSAAPEQRIGRLREHSPAALELALLLTPAARIEPELLRAMRLALLAEHGPSIEADLWFSPIVRSRHAAGIVLDGEAARLLRAELAQRWADPVQRHRLLSARGVMARLHERLSPALLLEERATWASVTGNWEELNDELARAVKSLLERQRPGLQAWVAQAVKRLPAEAFGTEAGQALRRLAAQQRTPRESVRGTADLLAELPTAVLGVWRFGGCLRLGALAAGARHAVSLPDTDPRPLELVWHQDGAERRRRLAIAANGGVQQDIGYEPASVVNAAGQRFDLPSFDTWTGPDAHWTVLAIDGDADSQRVRLAGHEGKLELAAEDWDGPAGAPEAQLAWVEAAARSLWPPQLLDAGASLADCRLVLDTVTAAFPWELASPVGGGAGQSLGLRGRCVRTFAAGAVPGGAAPDGEADHAPFTVFVSHARADREAALRLAAGLRKAGVEVWMDEGALRAGEDWAAAIERAIERCSLFLAVLSQQALESKEGWHFNEWQRAIDRQQRLAPGRIFIVPVVVDGATPDPSRMPAMFSFFQTAQLRGGEIDERFLAMVLEQQREHRARVGLSPQLAGADARFEVFLLTGGEPQALAMDAAAARLAGRGYRVSRPPAAAPAKQWLAELYSRRYRLLHLAGDRAGGTLPALRIGSDTTLGVNELSALRTVPEFVLVHALDADADNAPGWARALLDLGVSAALIARQPMAAAGAASFLYAFYAGLAGGCSVAEATWLARSETRRLLPESPDWAAFELWGDGDYRLPAPAVAQAAQPSTTPTPSAEPATSDPVLLAMRALDRKSVPLPGLFALRGHGPPVLEGPLAREGVIPSPALLLLHPMASNTMQGFEGLWSSANQATAWQPLLSRYQGRVYAFEHWALSLGPVHNALALAQALPPGAEFDLLTVSNGGLIGELLARAMRVDGEPIDATDLELAEPADHEALRALGQELRAKRLKLGRFVRVACPARGTPFPQRAQQTFGKLSRALSVMGSALGYGAYEALGSIAYPERVPGLRAVMPGSPLLRLILREDIRLAGELSVVAGRFVPGSFRGRLIAPVLNLFLDADNDLLVPTESMYAGPPRLGGTHSVLFAGGEVDHYSYFKRSDIVATIRDRLLGVDPPGLWQRLPDDTASAPAA